jgi:hypothetical protein
MYAVLFLGVALEIRANLGHNPLRAAHKAKRAWIDDEKMCPMQLLHIYPFSLFFVLYSLREYAQQFQRIVQPFLENFPPRRFSLFSSGPPGTNIPLKKEQ